MGGHTVVGPSGGTEVQYEEVPEIELPPPPPVVNPERKKKSKAGGKKGSKALLTVSTELSSEALSLDVGSWIYIMGKHGNSTQARELSKGGSLAPLPPNPPSRGGGKRPPAGALQLDPIADTLAPAATWGRSALLAGAAAPATPDTAAPATDGGLTPLAKSGWGRSALLAQG